MVSKIVWRGRPRMASSEANVESKEAQSRMQMVAPNQEKTPDPFCSPFVPLLCGISFSGMLVIPKTTSVLTHGNSHHGLSRARDRMDVEFPLS